MEIVEACCLARVLLREGLDTGLHGIFILFGIVK